MRLLLAGVLLVAALSSSVPVEAQEAPLPVPNSDLRHVIGLRRATFKAKTNFDRRGRLRRLFGGVEIQRPDLSAFKSPDLRIRLEGIFEDLGSKRRVSMSSRRAERLIHDLDFLLATLISEDEQLKRDLASPRAPAQRAPFDRVPNPCFGETGTHFSTYRYFALATDYRVLKFKSQFEGGEPVDEKTYLTVDQFVSRLLYPNGTCISAQASMNPMVGSSERGLKKAAPAAPASVPNKPSARKPRS
jgi:hypothetical protein